MKQKIFAIATVVIMMSVSLFSVCDVSDYSDAVAQTGRMDVFVYDGSSWDSDLAITAYDGCQALNDSDFYVEYTDSSYATRTTSNESQTIEIDSTYGGITTTYTYPNPEYGQFESIDYSETSASDWTVYINIGSSSIPNWVQSSVTIGWLRPFSDYSAVKDANNVTCATANIALVYGSGTPSSLNIGGYINSEGITLQNVVSITNTSTYEYHFTIRDTLGSASVQSAYANAITYNSGTYTYNVNLSTLNLSTGFTLVGYGSDANLALYQALGCNGNLVFQDKAPSVWNEDRSTYDYYSWMGELFGVGDDDSSGNWHYWETKYKTSGSDVYCMFNLGYYSSLDGTYNGTYDEFVLTYL